MFPEICGTPGCGASYRGIEGRLEREVLIGVRFMNLMQQNDASTAVFRISNCNSEQVTIISLKGEYKLYERQQKFFRKIVAC